jgi:hypothetical protein
VGLRLGVRGVAQLGSAPALGAGGRRFKSGRPDHLEEGRIAPVSEKEAGVLVPPDRVRQLVEALSAAR